MGLVYVCFLSNSGWPGQRKHPFPFLNPFFHIQLAEAEGAQVTCLQQCNKIPTEIAGAALSGSSVRICNVLDLTSLGSSEQSPVCTNLLCLGSWCLHFVPEQYHKTFIAAS